MEERSNGSNDKISPAPPNDNTRMNDATQKEEIEMSEYSLVEIADATEPMILPREKDILNKSMLRDDYSMEQM